MRDLHEAIPAIELSAVEFPRRTVFGPVIDPVPGWLGWTHNGAHTQRPGNTSTGKNPDRLCERNQTVFEALPDFPGRHCPKVNIHRQSSGNVFLPIICAVFVLFDTIFLQRKRAVPAFLPCDFQASPAPMVQWPSGLHQQASATYPPRHSPTVWCCVAASKQASKQPAISIVTGVRDQADSLFSFPSSPFCVRRWMIVNVEIQTQIPVRTKQQQPDS
ncbi:hypothetical protein QBC45DRAFT_486011 [Copromyces sp. CBS 386.78]|nr:hypothetical protein QBC45DRAFT_486011 [Copromyces sp. CBS 386.78]